MKTRLNPQRPSLILVVLLAVVAASALNPISPVQGSDANNGRLANQPLSEYSQRRQRLLELVSDGIVVLIGAREEDFGEVGRFRQKNDFMYLTGVQTPGAYLLMAPAGLISDAARAKEIVFIPSRNPEREKWTGVQIGPGLEAQKLFGVEEIAPAEQFDQRLGAILSSPPFKLDAGPPQKQAKIYTVVPHGPTAAMNREHHFIQRIKSRFPSAQIADVSVPIAELRKIKSGSEIEVLQRAIDITIEAHFDAARTIGPGRYEYEVQAALEYAFARNGAERPGFPSIVGAGFHSTVLHYNENRNRIESGDLIVIDIGAEYSFYTADLTRTYPAGGKFSQRQREVYLLVLEAQRACEKALKPGVTTIAALKQIAMDVMKKSPLRDEAGNTLERYFIHGLGHWLGMDVHDVGNYGPIPPGSVITIEPGIYIPQENLGIRIEDDYLVTETGLVKMSAKLPSDPEAVEKMVSGSSSVPSRPPSRR